MWVQEIKLSFSSLQGKPSTHWAHPLHQFHSSGQRLCMCGYLHVRGRARDQRPETGIGSPGAEVTGSCELPNNGAGSWTWVLWKNRTCPQVLGHFPNSTITLYDSTLKVISWRVTWIISNNFVLNLLSIWLWSLFPCIMNVRFYFPTVAYTHFSILCSLYSERVKSTKTKTKPDLHMGQNCARAILLFLEYSKKWGYRNVYRTEPNPQYSPISPLHTSYYMLFSECQPYLLGSTQSFL